MFTSMKICTNSPDELQRLLFSQGYKWHSDTDKKQQKVVPLWSDSWIFTHEDGTISWAEHDCHPDAQHYLLVFITDGDEGHYTLEKAQSRFPD